MLLRLKKIGQDQIIKLNQVPFLREILQFFLKNRFEIALYLLMFLINTAYSLWLNVPTIADENGTMANAAFLSGIYDWSTCYSSSLELYWGYGYSIFYIPLFFLFNNMKIIYKLALIINAFFISFIPFFAYKLQLNYFDIKERKLIFFSSLCVGLFPAYTILSKFAWNETMLALLPWIIIYVFFELTTMKSRMKKKLLSGLLGFLLIYSYAVHGRGLAIMLATFTCIVVYWIITRKKIIDIASFFIMMITCYLIDYRIKKIIIDDLIQVEESQARNTLQSILSGSMLEAFKPVNFFSIFKGFMGQSYYIVATTFGIIIIAVIVLYIYAKKILVIKVYQEKDVNKFLFGLYSCMLALITIIMSTTFFSASYITGAVKRREYFIYGRYNEVVCALGIFFVIQFFISGERLNKRYRNIGFAIIIFILLWGTLITSREIISRAEIPLSSVMVSGLVGFAGRNFLGETQLCNFIYILLWVIIIQGVFQVFLSEKHTILSTLFITGVFIYSSNYYLNNVLYINSNAYEKRIDKFSLAFSPIYDLNSEYPNIYLSRMTDRSMSIQFALADYDVEFLNCRSFGYKNFSKVENNSFIISEEDEHFDLWLEDCYLYYQDEGLYIWAYGKQLKQSIEQRVGYLEDRKELTFTPIDLNTTNNLKNEEKIVLNEGSMSYGPYCHTTAGTYKVTVSGKNLDIAAFDVVRQAGTIEVPISKRISQDTYSITFLINLKTSVEDLEIRVKLDTLPFKDKDKLVVVENIKLEILSQEDMKQASEIGNGYTMLIVNDYQAGLNIKKGRECMQTQRMILIRGNGYAYITNNLLVQGKYRLIFRGKGLENAKIEFYHEDNRTANIKLMDVIAVDEVLDITISAFEQIDDLKIVISNNDPSLQVEFEKVEIISLQ